jgi:hypothetical protein
MENSVSGINPEFLQSLLKNCDKGDRKFVTSEICAGRRRGIALDMAEGAARGPPATIQALNSMAVGLGRGADTVPDDPEVPLT